MGMFDYISVADKLPTNAEIDAACLDMHSTPFQTKDLDNIMATYYIQGGKLFVEKYRNTEWVENSESFMGGYIDRQDPYQEEVFDHHGKIRFYHMIDKDGYDHWIEYEAYFTRGKMEEIKLVEYRKTENSDRKKSLEEIFERADIQNKKWYNKFIFHTKCWRGVRKLVMKFLSLLDGGINWLRLNFP